MKKLIFIIGLFFVLAGNCQIPSIGVMMKPQASDGIFYPKHGYLYNWWATQGTGSASLTSSDDWYVARYGLTGEWFTIITYVGGSTVAGRELKEAGTAFWSSGNTGLNTYGLTLRGSGYRDAITGVFTVLLAAGRYWTATAASATTATCPTFVYNLNTSNAAAYNKKQGSSVRLVKVATGVPDGTITTYTGNDGKVYEAIAINGIYWLIGNLSETKLRSGDLISEVTDNTDWSNLTTSALCAYNNDISNVF